jgi:hypothetical protein
MLIVIHIGQTPNLKKVNATFLYQGKFVGTIGQLTPSPLYSLLFQLFMLSFIVFCFNDLAEEMINAGCKECN